MKLKDETTNKDAVDIRIAWDQLELAHDLQKNTPPPIQTNTNNNREQLVKSIKKIPTLKSHEPIHKLEPLWKYFVLTLFIGTVGYLLLSSIINPDFMFSSNDLSIKLPQLQTTITGISHINAIAQIGSLIPIMVIVVVVGMVLTFSTGFFSQIKDER